MRDRHFPLSRRPRQRWMARTPAAMGTARGSGVPLGHRLISPVLSALTVLATLVVDLARLTLAPVLASADPTPVTAYGLNSNSSVTSVDLSTNTPGPGIPVGSRPISIAITAGSVQLPTRAMSGLLLTGLMALVFVGYQLSNSWSRHQAAIS